MHDYKLCQTFTYFSFKVTGCVFISAFVSLVGILIRITISAATIKICTITAGIKKCKPIIKKKHEKARRHEKGKSLIKRHSLKKLN